MTHADLLPCPFCGGEADMTEYSHQHAEGIGYMVECQSCSAMGEPFAVEGQMPDRHDYTKQRAITAWNTRTPDTAPSHNADLIAGAETISERPATPLDAAKTIFFLITALRAAEAENARLKERFGTLTHHDACILSLYFNRAASLGNEQHYRINEWLKNVIQFSPDREPNSRE